MTGDMEPRDVRVSDAEREHVGELLQRAVGQGRRTVTLELDKTGGSTTIVVPKGATVDTDGLRVTMASVKVFTVRRIEPGPVHFVITGRSTMGEVRVVPSRQWRLGPLTVHRPFRLSWGRTTQRF